MLRLRMQRWLLKRIEKALVKRRAQGKEKILFLARLLANEVKATGYDYKGFGSFSGLDSFTVRIWNDKEIEVGSTNHNWEVRGPLDEPEGYSAAEPTA